MTQTSRRAFLQGAGSSLVAQTGRRAPSILVVLCDQLNASVISPYGGPVAAPNLERLARRGVVFRNAVCPTPFCSPTRASLITGLWPHAHGIVHNVMRKDYPTERGPATEEGISRQDVTVDGLLAARGYSTHQYGKWHLSGDALPYLPDPYGEHHEYEREMAPVFDEIRKLPKERWMDWYGWALPVSVDPTYRRAFESAQRLRGSHYSDFLGKMGRLELPARDTFDFRVADRTIRSIKAAGSGPFAITCSLNWPHDPNVIPSPYYERFEPGRIELPANFGVIEKAFEGDLSRTAVSPGEERVREFLRIYYGTVQMIDEQVGRVLDALEASGRAQDTIVVFTADHGDMAGGHGMIWKSTSAYYDEIARVPLIISWPRRIHPGKSEAAASTTDIAPTLLDLAGHPVPGNMQGVSLAPALLERRSSNGYVYTFSERVKANPDRTRRLKPGTAASLMIRGAGWKYSWYPSGAEYLYHLDKDPGETTNLASDNKHSARKNEMRRLIRDWLRRTSYPGGSPQGMFQGKEA